MSNVHAADRLGAIKAQLAEIKKIEDALKAELTALGVGSYEGDMFRATVSITEKVTVDWKAVCEKLEPSRQLVTAHTSHTSFPVVRVFARKA